MEYGSTKSFVNLFRPLLRKNSFGVIFAERLRNVKYFENSSQLVCNMCVRKIKHCCNNFEICIRSKRECWGEIVYVRYHDLEFNQLEQGIMLVIYTNLIPADHNFYAQILRAKKRKFKQ